MKKIFSITMGALLLAASLNASAFWGNNGWGGNGYNDWPVFTPMYWMEEMSNSWDNNGYYGGPGYSGAPYGAPYGGGYGVPYGGYVPEYPAYPTAQAPMPVQ